MSNTITINRRIAATVETVYQAWTDAEVIKRWMGPGAVTVIDARADARTGGKYRIHMRSPEGEDHIVNGEYEETVPNERLVFTWQWEGNDLQTTVRVEFKAVDNNHTELTLHHAGFPDADTRNHHEQGWNGCLDKLESALV